MPAFLAAFPEVLGGMLSGDELCGSNQIKSNQCRGQWDNGVRGTIDMRYRGDMVTTPKKCQSTGDAGSQPAPSEEDKSEMNFREREGATLSGPG